MKISKVIFHIKPIPSHPWWECKKDRKSYWFLVKINIIILNFTMKSFSVWKMLRDVSHFTKMANFMQLAFSRERKTLESEDRFLWQRRLSAFRLILLIIDYIRGESFVSVIHKRNFKFTSKLVNFYYYHIISNRVSTYPYFNFWISFWNNT